jgi:hypothetical protein
VSGNRLKTLGSWLGLGAFVGLLIAFLVAHLLGFDRFQPLLMAIAGSGGALGLVLGGFGVFASESIELRGRFGGAVTIRGIPARGIGVGFSLAGLGALCGAIWFLATGLQMSTGILFFVGLFMAGAGIAIVSLVPTYAGGAKSTGVTLKAIRTVFVVVTIGGWGVATFVCGIVLSIMALTR